MFFDDSLRPTSRTSDLERRAFRRFADGFAVQHHASCDATCGPSPSLCVGFTPFGEYRIGRGPHDCGGWSSLPNRNRADLARRDGTAAESKGQSRDVAPANDPVAVEIAIDGGRVRHSNTSLQPDRIG
jgi:hypothetical protein